MTPYPILRGQPHCTAYTDMQERFCLTPTRGPSQRSSSGSHSFSLVLGPSLSRREAPAQGRQGSSFSRVEGGSSIKIRPIRTLVCGTKRDVLLLYSVSCACVNEVITFSRLLISQLCIPIVVWSAEKRNLISPPVCV